MQTLRKSIRDITVIGLAATRTSFAKSCTVGMSTSIGKQQPLKVATWNIAAINNNPFEYWVTYDDPGYNSLMENVQRFISDPGDDDVPVNTVFTDAMFQELKVHLSAQNWDGVAEVEQHWDKDLKHRNIVTGILKDTQLGAKRLMSMPDRITNTINTADGSKVYRPTAINCYPGLFTDFQDWWVKWQQFMFSTPINLPSRDGGAAIQRPNAASMLVPIKRSKYPAISEMEESISLPLQTLYGAVFDAILIHMLQLVAPGGETGEKSWQELRTELTVALNSEKLNRTMDIIASQYSDHTVLFVQEAAQSFPQAVASVSSVADTYHLAQPEVPTGRDQNSVMLLNRKVFDTETIVDVTTQVVALMNNPSLLAAGDLLVTQVRALTGANYLLASFHGDTNGLATIPVVQAVHEYASTELGRSHKLIFGLDANTYETGIDGKRQGVAGFGEFYSSLGLNSCWGQNPDPKQYTTYNARTFLQTQLAKACAKEDARRKGDVNPKDFVLFYDSDMKSEETKKDNTGHGEYIEDMMFPTLTFPSDHAVLSTTLIPVDDTESRM